MILLQQILASVLIILGIAIGQSLALKVFGRVKNAFLNIINIIVLVTALNWIFAKTKILSSFFPYLNYLLYFSFSFLIIFFIRGLTTLGGIKGRKTLREREEEVTDKVLKAMLKAGFSKSRIKKLMKKADFSKDLVKKKLSKIKEEEYIPVSIEKLNEIERKLGKIQEKLRERES